MLYIINTGSLRRLKDKILTQEEFELNNIKQKSIRSILGKLSRKNKTGFFGYSCEERSSVAQRGGFAAAKINKIRGTGIFDKTE